MSSFLRLTLAQQLKQLESDFPPVDSDPESAYTSLDPLALSQGKDEGREHYLGVGTSRLRRKVLPVEQTLLSEKYAGRRRGRMKIFDDDDDEEEDEEEDGELEKDENQDEEAERSAPSDGDGDAALLEGDSGGESPSTNGEDVEDEEDRAEEEDDGEDDDGREDEDAEEDEDGRPQLEDVSGRGTSDTARQALDPVASLRQSRMKDVEKGQGIKRQKANQVSLFALL